jgi:PAS domain S-box-containing protein
MSWTFTTWLVIASACATLAAIHALVWLRQRDAGANAAFTVLALSVAAMAIVEMRQLHAQTAAEFGRLAWWYQLPVWSALVSVVVFVRLYFGAGRLWLGAAAVGLRTLALAINFFTSPSITYREITALDKVTVFGESLTVAIGRPSPWLAVAQLSLLALLLFVADASWAKWREGERRRALVIGGSLLLFVAAGTTIAVLSFWGVVKLPVFATLFFVPIVLAMSFELSLDQLRAVRLAAELKAKEGELRGSEARLALAADAANAGLWSVEAGTGKLWATPRALTMFGLDPVGEHHVDEVLRSVHPDDRERVRRFAAGERDDDRRAATEYRVVAPGGEVRWYASIGRTHRGGPGMPRGLMGVTLDITDRKRNEDQAARQRVELEHLSRVATLTELSGALAHELNQPLAIIMSNAEAAQHLLEQPQPDLAEIRAILSDIVAEDERAGEVIKRLRRLLKRGAASRQPLSINEIVAGVLQFLRADLVRRGVAVDIRLAESLPAVLADRVPIEQVLINLIGNACDAMAGNAAGDRRLAIETEAADDAVIARVLDCGAGLPADAEKVFEPFYTTKTEGLGMGLAISRSIVAAHGGRLWAEPNAGRGATFLFSLPLARSAA